MPGLNSQRDPKFRSFLLTGERNSIYYVSFDVSETQERLSTGHVQVGRVLRDYGSTIT